MLHAPDLQDCHGSTIKQSPIEGTRLRKTAVNKQVTVICSGMHIALQNRDAEASSWHSPDNFLQCNMATHLAMSPFVVRMQSSPR